VWLASSRERFSVSPREGFKVGCYAPEKIFRTPNTAIRIPSSKLSGANSNEPLLEFLVSFAFHLREVGNFANLAADVRPHDTGLLQHIHHAACTGEANF
jgi:hypothetical protein